MLKLKLQYFGHLMWRLDSLEKILMLGKIKGQKRRGWQRIKWLDSITNSIDMNLSKLQETVEDRGAWHAVVHEIPKSRTWLINWTITTLTTRHQGRNFQWTVGCVSSEFGVEFKEFITINAYPTWRIPCTEEPGGLHTVHGVTKNWTWLSGWTEVNWSTEKFVPHGYCKLNLETMGFWAL